MIDRLLVNGRFLTMDRSRPTATAVAIRNGRITAVGETGGLLRSRDRSTELVDLGGRCVVPGFIDAHTHFALTALEPISVDVSPRTVGDIPALQRAIADAAAVTPGGRWIRAFGYLSHACREVRHPTRWELDEAAPDNPVVVVDAGVHRVVANSAALAAAGIAGGVTDDPCCVVDRRADHEPTGLLAEAATNEVHRRAVDDLAERHHADLLSLVEANARRHLELGITAVHDAWVSPSWDALMRCAARAGRLPMYYLPLRGSAAGLFAAPTRWLDEDDGALAGEGRIRRGGIKLFADGAGATAATCHRGHAATSPRGILFYEQAVLDELVSRAMARDLVVAIHAIGDRAIDVALASTAHGRSEAAGSSARLRIEHFFTCTHAHVELAARLDLHVVAQPVGIWQYGDLQARHDDAGGFLVHPIAELLSAGAAVAASSDAPCFEMSPMLSIEAMVERRTANGRHLAPEQAVSVEQAIETWTLGAAFAGGTEDIEGSLVPGKLANLAVLADDPRCAEGRRIGEILVDETWVDGAPAFRRDTAGPPRLHEKE